VTTKREDDGLREVPAQIHRPDGGTTEARIVMPAWTPDELVSIVRTQAEWGNITRQQADREIAHIREGAARQQSQQRPEPRKRSGRTR
jgi:hypothetical protein